MASTPKKKAKRTATSEKQKALNSEYNKQVKRIKQFLKRATGRGYLFFTERTTVRKNKHTGEMEAVVPTNVKYWELPTRPKKITEASIRKLKEITSEYLYKRAMYIDPVYGEPYTAEEGRKRERKRASQKAANTRKRRTEVYTETKRGYKELEHDQWLDEIRAAQPPTEGAYQYIFTDITNMLESLAPGEHRYTKKGLLWEIDTDKLRKSNALTTLFEKLLEEASLKDELADYAMFLQAKRYDLSNYLEGARRSSKAEIVTANFEAIAKILNWDKELEPHTADALERYLTGEIDDF